MSPGGDEDDPFYLVACHDPQNERLYGWIFNAWQYRADQPEREVPYWLALTPSGNDDYPMAVFNGVDTCLLPDQYWLLRRAGDHHLWAIVDPSYFDTWARKA